MAVLLSGAVPAAPPDGLPDGVARSIADMMALSRTEGDALWPGYGAAPFGFLLVEPERETLLCDPRLPPGFVRQPDLPGLGCLQAAGPPSWRTPSLLAAMPGFGGASVIVMGTPTTTGLPSGDWQMTILHEHFHQWQSDLPGYYARVAALDLAAGDSSGLWMLNYPFLYDNPVVGRAFARASRALAHAIAARPAARAGATRAYRAARAAFRQSVSAQDWRYFEFQLWQEGIARWTEFTLGVRSTNPAVRVAAHAARRKTLKALAAPNLKSHGRISVYAYGAGEALLLERLDPRWRACYTQDMALGPRFDQRCRRAP